MKRGINQIIALLMTALLLVTEIGNYPIVLAAEPDAAVSVSETDASENSNKKMDSGEQAVSADEIIAESQYDSVSENEVSRLEWWEMLISAFHLTVDEDNYPDNYYYDINSDTEYYRDIMVATEFGLVDVDMGEPVSANDAATRDFAAHTLNTCIQYVNESDEFTYTDVDSVAYRTDAQVAVDQGWFLLKDGCFDPNAFVTTEEYDNLKNVAENIYEDLLIDPEHNNTYTLKDGVKNLGEVDAVLSGEDGILVRNEIIDELQDGDIFIIIQDEIPYAFKAVSVELRDNDTYIKIEDINLDEAFSDIDIESSQPVNLADVDIETEEDVELSYIIGGTSENDFEDGIEVYSVEDLAGAAPSALKATFNKPVTAKYSKSNDQSSYSISVTLSNLSLDTSYSLLPPSATVTLKGEASLSLAFSSNLELPVIDFEEIKDVLTLDIPLGVAGFFKVEPDLGFTGSASFNSKWDFAVGMRCDLKGLHFTPAFHKKSFTLNCKAEVKVGLKGSLGLRIGGAVKGDIYTSIGAKGSVSYISNGILSDEKCWDITAYVYWDIGAEISFDIGVLNKKKVSASYSIYDKKNSPVKLRFHIEDGKVVDECTRGSGSSSGEIYDGGSINPNIRNGGYYTPVNSRYGSIGLNTGRDAAGELFTIFETKKDEDNKEATITKYNGNVSALEIPAEIDGYKVVAIAASVFKNRNELVHVSIPDSVTTIGEHAFSKCTNLSSVKLSKGLLTLGYSAFANDDKLEAIEIPRSLQSTTTYYGVDSSAGPFNACDGLKTVTFESGLTEIVDHLFANCPGIETVTIPDTVTVINDKAFYNASGLKMIKIPDKVQAIPNYAFTKCTSLEKVTIGKSVDYIRDSAFNGCSSLKEIIIPDNVTSMGTYTFSGCSSLEKAVLPNIRQNLMEGTFSGCVSLVDITLPESLTAIRSHAFEGCTSLPKINIPSGVTVIEEVAFKDCDALKEIKFEPKDSLTIGQSAFRYCDTLEKISLSSNVTSMGNYCFESCPALKDITLGKGITAIPQYCFANDESLESITLPYYVKSIGAYAFLNDTKLTAITIPRNTTTIATTAFSYKDRLTIYGVSGTYAETFANENGFIFVNQEIKATDVSFSQDVYTVLRNSTLRISYTVNPDDYTDEMTWVVSKGTDYVSVTDGIVKGLKATVADSPAVIKLSVGDQIASCKIIVLQPVTSLSLSRSSLTLDAGDSIQLTCSVYPDSASDKTVSWSSSDDKIATVDAEGRITALSQGECTITATANDGSETNRSCKVTVKGTAHLAQSEEDLQSDHPYGKNSSDVWIYKSEGAGSISVTFSEDTKLEEDSEGDYILIKDKDGNQIGKYYGSELAGKTVNVPGDTFWMQLVSDAIDSKDAGFSVAKIETSAAPVPSVTPTPTPTAGDDTDPTPAPSPSVTPEATPTPTSGTEITPTPVPSADDGILRIAAKGKVDAGKMIRAKLGSDQQSKIKKYASSDAKIASVNKKGIVKGKKDGKVTVTAYEKVGKEFVALASVEVQVSKPVFKFTDMVTDADDEVDLYDYISNLPEGVKVSWSIPPKKASIAKLTDDGCLVPTGESGSVKVTCLIGEGSYAAKYTATLKFKIPKLAETTKVKVGKPAKITIKNVPKGADIEWYWYATDAAIDMVGTSKPNTVKVTVLIDGIEEAEVYAIVDGVTYTTKLIME